MSTGVAGMLSPWRIELLGDLRAVRDGRVVTHFRTRKTGLLLACLALGGAAEGHRHRGRPRDELADLLWPDDPPDVGRASLRNALSLLRHVLEPEGVPRSSVLVADRASVRLKPDAFTTDVAEFEATFQLAARTRHRDERARRLAQAVDLYRGELLAGDYDAWVLWEREQLAERYFRALGKLVAHLEEAGDLARALDYARRGASLDPLHEETHCALMRLYAALGQPAGVRRQYRELECLLAQHLGARPSPETEHLLASLIDGSEPAAAPSPAAPSATASFHRQPATAGRGRAPEGGLPFTASLPQPSTRFFGRSHEIARLRALLREPGTRLVTLTGPGGCGKTRLALELALRLRAPWEEAVAFVPLQDVGEARGILDKLLESLRLHRSPHMAPMDQVASALSQQPVLLVLDNMEHLLPEGAAVVQELLERVAELTLLATSRQRLGVLGEQLFPIPSLTSEPSVALFVDRARAVREDLLLTEQDRATVAELCRRLEGLPLSLELAAARTDVLTPGQILERLGNRLTLLRRGEGPGPERHRSLRAALEWSYRLLSPELARFFARLSVFRGGWTLAAAAAVCGEGGNEPSLDALEGLSQLVARSLVVAEETDGEMRYRLLETLREFAWEQLDSQGEVERMRRRHLEYYAALAQQAERQMMGSEQETWVERLEREHDNLRAALDGCRRTPGDLQVGLQMAAALRWFWWLHGHWREGKERLVYLLSRASAGERTLARARAIAAAGALTWFHGEFAEAQALAEEGLTLSCELPDFLTKATCVSVLGLCYYCRHGDTQRAVALSEECLMLCRAHGEEFFVALALFNLGFLLCEQGQGGRGCQLLKECFELARKAGAKSALASWLGFGAIQFLRYGEEELAQGFCREGLALAHEMGNKRNIADCLEGLAGVACARGRMARAARLFGMQEAVLESIHASVNPGVREYHDRMVAAARTALGEEAFAAAWAAGRAMPLKDAITFALDETHAS